MSVGLYDIDFFTYHQTIFNLELMKLSTYFKKKKEITIMSPSFSPERYSLFFLRKDFNDGNFLSNLSQYSNLKYGGFAFSNNKYIPLPIDIEKSIPDYTIYLRYEKLFTENRPNNKTFFTSIKNGLHLRLSLDGIKLWEDFEKQISPKTKAKVIFLHDYNVNAIEDSIEIINYLIEKYSYSKTKEASISVKFPVQCNDFNDFLQWLNFIFSSTNFQIQYNNMLKDEQIVEIVEKILPVKSTNIFYNPLPAASCKDDFLEEDLIKIFKQVLFLYKNQKQFSLICSNNFKVPHEIKKMFNLFTAYGRSQNKYVPQTALIYFVKQLRDIKRYKNEIIDKQEAKEVFYYTQKHYPELFKLYYEASGAVYEGGKLNAIRYRN